MKKPGIYKLILYTVFAGFLLPNLFATGIFGDGLIYAVVSRNLAAGQGSWWDLHYSAAIFSPFAEHPPLLFWLESLWFRLIGDHHYTEKTFSLLLALGMVVSLRYFWRQMTTQKEEKEAWWFPILLWLLVPTIHWAYPNNMLENLLVLFTSWAIWLGWYAPSNKRAFFTGIFVFFAFMTKGMVGLFPLAVFLMAQLSLQENTFRKSIQWTFIATFSFSLCLAISLIPEAARIYWTQYFDIQLFATLRGERLVQDHVVNLPRYYLLTRIFTELINPLLLCGILLFTVRRSKNQKLHAVKNQRYAWFFLGIAASASLPLLLSPKQHSFYLIPAIPWFIFALAKFVGPLLYSFLQQWQPKQLSYKVSYLLFSGLLFTALFLCGYRANTPGRDAVLMQNIDSIAARVPQGTAIGIPQSLVRHHSLHGYFQRNYQQDLVPSDTSATYWLCEKDSTAPIGFQPTTLPLAEYSLHKRIKN